MLGSVLGALWWALMLPFRLLAGLVELFGRLTAGVLGFALMVLGVAFWASPMPLVGIPVFVVGMLITLRALDWG